MRRVMREVFLWRFAGGFALGAVAVLALQPGGARHEPVSAPSHRAQRS